MAVSNKSLDNKVREKYIEMFSAFLAEKEEILRTASNEIAFPIVDSEGNESPVNYRIVNQYFMVEGTNTVFTLRNGSETVCVFNETLRGLARNLTESKK